jgi:hypothetical protein
VFDIVTEQANEQAGAAVKLQIHIPEALGSNIGRDNGCPVFVLFLSHSRQIT